jgi:hypothetical protein
VIVEKTAVSEFGRTGNVHVRIGLPSMIRRIATMSDMQAKLTNTAPDPHHHSSCGIRSFIFFVGNLGTGLYIEGESDGDGRGGISAWVLSWCAGLGVDIIRVVTCSD